MNEELGVFKSDSSQNFMITSSKILNKLVSSNNNSYQSSQTENHPPINHSQPFSKYSLSEVEMHESSRSKRPYQPKFGNQIKSGNQTKSGNQPASYPEELGSNDERSMIISAYNINYSPLISIEDEIPQEKGLLPNPPSKENVKATSITYVSHDGHIESHGFNHHLINNSKHQAESELSKSLFANLDTFSILYPGIDRPRSHTGP